MSDIKKRFINLLFNLMIACIIVFPAAADDDHHGRHRERSHERYAHDEHHEGHMRPATNPAYKEICGGCHFAYPPELLPAASWNRILSAADAHFGEIVELDDNAKKKISGYLQSNAAETSSAKRAVKILHSLGNQVPTRITDIPYIQKKHRGIPQDFRHSKAVGSMSNCIACHPTAERGIYDDDTVRIPR